MFCPNCGKDSPPGAKFCESCGNAMPSDQTYQAPPAYGSQPFGQPMYAPIPLKNAGIAAVLAFLWAGLGHIYLGQIGKGIMFMLVYIILWVIGFLTFFGLILPFIFWIWQLYDAYTKANEYNASVQQTGRAPW
ncbi:MAG TPA: zinc-ribbon domain-containing protein [Methanomassiliicoccaceae archaeon]|jgi:TM2 domain-containing membrane protein YozV|nr:zinc-ribbon domain-containing protein [Euryarchaeota archaeon]HOB38858.1 zinc-ribbon domain-containing protein [Methanomassiliicoccaceae archaeon]HOK28805.1 zinc-ribbon domain-containing protein [Methanomassiliicoccaceae archaeon]HOQ25219.1 zinc-ribbon domain-containing protein [Methanomassiliicoccaceae archaeon]HPP44356.1 zinc-ribbon domain-containing protein [Methanomassiliicoccaceae archaeon]